MKFYMIYEHVFPFGYGIAALLCFGIGLWGFLMRKPLVFSFTVSFVTILGIIIPLFLLSINHFLVAWPLEIPTTMLNMFGVIGSLILLCILWIFGFEYTIVGASPSQVRDCARALLGNDQVQDRGKLLPEKGGRLLVLGFPLSRICYVRISGRGSFNNSELLRVLRSEVCQRVPQASYRSFSACVLVGMICTVVASISWCVSTECIPYMF